MRLLWRRLPWRWRSAVAQILEPFGPLTRPLPAPPLRDRRGLSPGPIVVSGFFSDTRGVARAARLTADALRMADFEVIEHDITYLIDRSSPRPPTGVHTGGVWILVCNPVEALAVFDQHRELSEAPLYRIGSWAWELPEAPADWLEATRLFHAIWVPSRFCADALSASLAPIAVMPHRVSVSPGQDRGGAAGPVRFATWADLRSGSARKNPLGALSAYIEAFPQAGDTRLLVKLQGLSAEPGAVAEVKQLVDRRDDITLFTDRLSDAEMERFVEDTDVLVSLHRSEGFGLPLAEAMAAGKSVIATGWSGNLEFMTGQAARQLVGYSLVPVQDPTGAYVSGCWAEPDHADAVRLLRELAGDPELRAALGQANRAAMLEIGEHWTPRALAEHEFSTYYRNSRDGS